MKNTPLKLLIILGTFVLGGTAPLIAQSTTDTTYVWQSADGDPYNIQGAIVLDSPSSANGSASDVVSLTITDLADTYSWTPATGGGPGDLYTGAPFIVFQWSPSQILEMDLSTPGPKPEFEDALFEAHPNGTGSIWDFSTGEVADQSGEWVAAVPEPSTMVSLLFGSATFLAARRYAAARPRRKQAIALTARRHQ